MPIVPAIDQMGVRLTSPELDLLQSFFDRLARPGYTESQRERLAAQIVADYLTDIRDEEKLD